MAAGSLKIRLRRQQILDALQKEGQVTVSVLSAKLGVTTITIRSDLDALAAEGALLRVPGGAVAPVKDPAPVRAEAIELLAEKEAIAVRTLSQIPDGSTLFLNSGTTSLCVAKALLRRERLNIVTNSFAVARLLVPRPSFRVVLLGGELNADYGFTYGGDAQEQLHRYQADWAILSVDGIDADQGITTHHAEEAILDRMMLAQARKGLIVADHRKIGRAGFSRICPVNQQMQVITDSACDQTAVQRLRSSGVEVLDA